MDALVAGTLGDRRFNALLFGLFAALGLVLAATGVYGVMQYCVAQRTRELGIRMALGAKRPVVAQIVLWDAARLAAAGIAIGLVGALACTWLMRALLYEITPLDAPTFAGSASLLLVVAVLASYLPARRALRLEPVLALRAE
jgi:ABC-type antimicrobial peptide transport system permease subunit